MKPEQLAALNAAFLQFKDEHKGEIGKMKTQLDAIETFLSRSQFPGGSPSGDNAAVNDHKAAFLAWARKGVNENELRGLEIQANLSTLSDPDGGFLVPIEIEKNIERLALASVAMRRIARIVTARGEYTRPLSKGGATGGWVAEKASRPETDTPELQLFAPAMNEIYAMPSVTQKLLDMSDFDIENWLLEEINDVFVTTEGTGFITGNGVSQVKGIIDETLMVANASWVYGKTGYIAGGHASLLNNVDKLFDLQHALKPAYRQNAVWLMNDNTFNVIRKFKDGEGNYLWRPGLQDKAPDTLLGKPIEIDDNMPDIGVNAYPIAFGDFKRAYTIVDHVSGTRLLRDPYTTKGFVNFYVTKRLAGGISNYEALKFMKIATA
ncbi:phage major capsid protein [Syntrophorhabdus aromaticivorans]|uniref:phage major capsid protein n=1 Tax=Syntrophorhabdus aromaticivorans TaxID=328301 RepID=UPI000409626E|nr:phage major capsid protein [Syntrophorhabdus aromaticivorans]